MTLYQTRRKSALVCKGLDIECVTYKILIRVSFVLSLVLKVSLEMLHEPEKVYNACMFNLSHFC